MEKKENPIAQNVRRLRDAHHWTQEGLAAASGVDVRTGQRAERGHPLAVESLRAIASALDTTPDSLSVFDEEFTRSLREFQEKHSLIGLTPLHRGTELHDFLSGADAFHLQRVCELSDEQADAVANFEQDLKDYLAS